MMKIGRYEDMKATERQVRLWLANRRFSPQDYRNLSSYHKDLLHKLVCTPTHPTTYAERRDLYRKLCSRGGMAGRDSIDPVDSMTDEDLRTFFSPLTPSQGVFWDDWGCE